MTATPDDDQLTSRRLPAIVLGIAVAVGLGICLVIARIVFGSSGDEPPTAADRHALAEEVCPRVVTPHFYRISKAGKTSFLLGTRHAGVSLAKYPPAVARELRAAMTIVVESNLETPLQAPADAQPLEQALGPELWDRYRELVGSDAATDPHRQSVFAATSTLSLLYEDMSQLVDVEVLKLARASNKQIVGLEDDRRSDHLAETYLGIDTLRKGLRQISRRQLLANEVRRTLRSYCNGGGDVDSSSSSFDEVTNERTRAWVPKLVPMLAGGGVFVAVGSAHVDEGSLSLIDLLKGEGFVVEAVTL